MKIAISVLMCFLLAFMLIFPLGILISFFNGYSFEMTSITAYSIILLTLSVSLAVLGIFCKKQFNVSMIVLTSALLIQAVINSVTCIYHCHDNILFLISVLSSLACSIFLVIKHIKNMALKIVMPSIAGFLLGALAFPAFFIWMFSNFGSENIIQTYESPSGKYYADLIDDDQGALGGATDVYIYDKDSEIDFLVFKAKKKPQEIYVGRWGEFENAKIEWKDDNCIIINSKEYNVD